MNIPDVIYNVSTSQFSVARHAGGAMINGVEYKYDAKHDCLYRKGKKPKQEPVAVPETINMFEV